MTQSDPSRVMPIEVLDRMTVNEKLAHFARKDAFRLPRRDGETWGAPRRLMRKGLPAKLTPGGVDPTGGNVIRQSFPVIGRPCFGIPTARLVHGREVMIRQNGKLSFARCGECPIKATCQFVVDERLQANSRIREAHKDFQRHGGAEAFWSQDQSRAPGHALNRLVRELQDANFTTVNDIVIAAHYDKASEERRNANTERQRAYREGAKTSDIQTVGPGSAIVTEGRRMRAIIEAAQVRPNCPRWVVNLNAHTVAQVWAIKRYLSEQGKKHGPTHIARALQRSAPEVEHDAFRFRITRILGRLPQIEALCDAQNQSQN